MNGVKLILLLFMLPICTSILAQQQNGDYIYHYSVMDGMRNGIYKGEHHVAHLAKKGDFGLGTYNLLDGEMIVKDGVFYRIRSDGSIEKADPASQSPFNSLTNFEADTTVLFTFSGDFGELQSYILSLLPSKNLPYAVQVKLTLKTIIAGGAEKLAHSDTTGLAALMIKRPLYEGKNVRGTMVGFYNPAYMSNVDLSPFHFHFISDDKKFGGHLIDAKVDNTTVKLMLDEKDGYIIELLNDNHRFRHANFGNKDAKASY